MVYRLTPQVKKDLKEVWNYSFDLWGEVQADKYVRTLGKKKLLKYQLVGSLPLSRAEG